MVNIISLFNGISCGYLAFLKAGIQIDNYYSSEIDSYAIAISQFNFPNIKQIGDVTKIDEAFLKTLPKIHYLIGGSPCQGFSIAGDMLNFEDPRSKLFFEFVRILNWIQENNNKDVIFLLENVSMVQEWKDIISSYLKVNPIEINSSLLSAQHRKRLYWTNINLKVKALFSFPTSNIKQPEDKKIKLQDILEDGFTDREKSYCVDVHYVEDSIQRYFEKRKRQMIFLPKNINMNKYQVSPIPYHYYIDTDRRLEIVNIHAKKGKVCYIGTDSDANRVYSIYDKSVTLKALGGGLGAKTGLYWIPKKDLKVKKIIECIGKNTFNLTKKRVNIKLYKLVKDDMVIEGYIRALTPIECERLQNLPDNFTKFGDFNGKIKEISKSQRYKTIGNGWTVDVIVHILKSI